MRGLAPTAVMACLVGGWAPAAVGSPDLPVTSGSVATFSGDQSRGITNVPAPGFTPDVTTPPIYTIEVRDLTRDIAPAIAFPVGVAMQTVSAHGSAGAHDAYNGENGEAGSAGSDLTLHYDGGGFAILAAATAGSIGLELSSLGGYGGAGGDGRAGVYAAHGGDGGAGAAGGGLSLTSAGAIEVVQYGIRVQSLGNVGGRGGKGDSGTYGVGGNGAAGGAGGAVGVVSDSDIVSHLGGIRAESNGAAGGAGGNGGGTYGEGGDAGAADAGGAVTIANTGAIDVASGTGIYARSLGGLGGEGGDGAGIGGKGGTGGIGGAGGAVSVSNTGAITASGDQGQAISAQSLGGAGGDGGDGDGLVGIGGAAKGSAPGGAVTVTNSADLVTLSDTARGIFAQSVGGIAGSGGSAGGLFAFGADGNSGGAGGNVSVLSVGNVRTSGLDSGALFAQSVGGGGGSGGAAGGLMSIGGSGDAGGSGGTVSVANRGSLQTAKDRSTGILAQSVGGGGGDGGATIAVNDTVSIALGGSAGAGGDGGTVGVTSDHALTTAGADAAGIYAQSLGGGGGKGGYAVGVAVNTALPTLSVAIGGSGGAGGRGSEVSVDSLSDIATLGANAYGIFAESLGGGGGSGGFGDAASASLWSVGSVAIGVGGTGGAGGSGSKVAVHSKGAITTSGLNAGAILAQSIGGGGGAAGADFSLVVAPITFAFSLGGSGGNSSAGGILDIENDGAIATSGELAMGILAQSVGGGGGAGGFSIAAGGGGGAVALSLGGAGGSGGAGGGVEVDNTGGITTAGGSAHALLAQSVGGGGGAGGFDFSGSAGMDSVAVALGGDGDSGGAGGRVSVDNTGNIATAGAGAYGLLAQSVGGGGGAGGWAGSGTASVAFALKTVTRSVPSFSLACSMGGAGALGGGADLVSVHNVGSIRTAGLGSTGLLAQSVGGGGGDGGASVAASINFEMGKTYSANLSLSLGGVGGGGGSGAAVTVVNQGAVQTAMDDSVGLLAQSIGGGGGNGGYSVDTIMEANLGYTGYSEFQLSLALGGSAGGAGGGGGASGAVAVTSTAPVATVGARSPGIQAQSVGGGGGNGGYSVTGTLSLRQAIKTSASVGGAGGDGGAGGAVSVTTHGDSISTLGEKSSGISAQSVGGGGGHGGSSMSITLGDFDYKATSGFNVNIGASVGGAGGSGDIGGAVTVANRADAVSGDAATDIVTRGDGAYGIFAQSVGGGGGDGGASMALSLATQAYNATWTFGINAPPPKNFTVQATASVGGKGGNGNRGGAVSVDNGGNIATEGAGADAIFAQSLGGGGGDGGRSATFSYIMGAPVIAEWKAQLRAWTKDWKASTFLNFSLTANVGGNGGDGGDAGAVTLTNSGRIKVQGDDAQGLFAQSVGGGGGVGGSTYNIPTLPIAISKNPWEYLKQLFHITAWTVSVGGQGGSSGHGGAVVVTNSGSIVTTGNTDRPSVYGDATEVDIDNRYLGSHGIFAQSVGGGGGIGGAANIGVDFGRIGLGGSGGAGGDGGPVTVTNSGAIATAGHDSHGIWAQSVGGGGGMAGDIVRSPFNQQWYTYFGLGIGFALPGGDGGDGGAVAVTSTGDIATQGHGSYGIVAQSVGGGGGTGGIDTGYPGHLIFHGSAFHGAAGDGGRVSVSETGSISTQGAQAHGIVAQSAAGKGRAGVVTVNLTGHIVANGDASHGIVAQSLGAAQSNTIVVTVNSGSSVQGGTGTSYGVLFLDGLSNWLTNYGTISTVAGVAGVAVMQQTSYGAPDRGGLTIDNHGTLIGSLMQGDQAVTPDSQFMVAGMSLPSGSSTIQLNNHVGALYLAGPTIDLGSGTLTNSGTLYLSSAAPTRLTGDFAQTGSGVLHTAIDAQHKGGSLTVAGTATLGGTLKVDMVTDGPVRQSFDYTLLESSQPIVTDFAVLDLPPSTPLLGFAAERRSGSSVRLAVKVHSFTEVANARLHLALGQHLDALLPNATGEIATILGEFQRMSPAGYKPAFESLSPGIYDNETLTVFGITRDYVRSVQRRMQVVRDGLRAPGAALPFGCVDATGLAAGAGVPPTSRQPADRIGLWVDGIGQWSHRAETGGFGAYRYSLSGIALGLDCVLSERLAAGASFGYGHTAVSQDNDFASADIDSYYGALYTTYFTDRAYLAGAFAYGNQQLETSRRIVIGSIRRATQSDRGGDGYSFFLEAGLGLAAHAWELVPYASLLYTTLSDGRVVETGAGGLGMRVDSRRTDALVSELGARLSRAFATSKGTFVAEMKLGWQHGFDLGESRLPVSYHGAQFGFEVDGRNVDRDTAVLSAGLGFAAGERTLVSLSYDAELGDGYDAQSLMGQIRLSF